MTKWPLQNAKAEFSKVVDDSISEGPQIVTRRGIPTAVILSIAEFERLRSKQPNFKEFLRKVRLDDLNLERSDDVGRPVDL
jgi:prevent-host-death family protein